MAPNKCSQSTARQLAELVNTIATEPVYSALTVTALDVLRNSMRVESARQQIATWLTCDRLRELILSVKSQKVHRGLVVFLGEYTLQLVDEVDWSIIVPLCETLLTHSHQVVREGAAYCMLALAKSRSVHLYLNDRRMNLLADAMADTAAACFVFGELAAGDWSFLFSKQSDFQYETNCNHSQKSRDLDYSE